MQEILSYLGLGDAPVPAREDHGVGGETRLLSRGGYELWRNGNGDAEWIEVRSSAKTFRVTRPKAMLVSRLLPAVKQWADGVRTFDGVEGVAIRIVRRLDGMKLELRYRAWKPIRMCSRQARGIVLFADEIGNFARG